MTKTACARSRVIAAKASAISSPLFTPMRWTLTLAGWATASSSRKAGGAVGLFMSQRTASRDSLGMTSASTSNRLPMRPVPRLVTPVTLPPRSAQASDEAGVHGIVAGRGDDRDGAGGPHRGLGGHSTAGDDRGDFEADQVLGEAREPVEVAAGIARLERDVPAFDIPEVA